MQINRHKNTIVYVRQTTTAFLLRKKKIKGKLHCMMYGIWFGKLMDFKHARIKQQFELIINLFNNQFGLFLRFVCLSVSRQN